jgi:serine protease AprX
MAVTNAAIGADQVWEGFDAIPGVTGTGVGVAVIDSGIADVPALRGRVLASADFTDRRGRAIDAYGHGTHVAGIIAAAGRHGAASGVAPGAHLVNLKVLDEHGDGTVADVIEAIDWAVDHRRRFRIRVINLSLGGTPMQSWRDDPLCQAVQRAHDAGVVVVASAGNLGKTADGTPVMGGVTVPGVCPHAITVGALNTKGTAFRSDDEVASYSSRGPTRYDQLIKPDLVAPGNRILSLLAPGSTLAEEHPELVIGTGKEAQLQLSGTSMAGGVVSGAVSLLLEALPRLSPITASPLDR